MSTAARPSRQGNAFSRGFVAIWEPVRHLIDTQMTPTVVAFGSVAGVSDPLIG